MGAPFEGIARKIAIPFIGLTAIGWLLVVIGFGISTFKDESDLGRIPRDNPSSYPYWVVSLSGPLILAAAITHAALSAPIGPIVGAVTSFLNALFLTGLGMTVFNAGDIIRRIHDDDLVAAVFPDVPNDFALLFTGSSLAILFWTPVMMLWHFYEVKNE